MKRNLKAFTRTNQIIIDTGIFAFSFAAAYLIRFEGLPVGLYARQFMLWLPCLLVARLLLHWKLKIYRFDWRFVSLPDALSITRSLSAVTWLLLALRLLYPGWAFFSPWVRLPLSVISLEFLISCTGSLGARCLRRILHERRQKLTLTSGRRLKRVILYGAGRAGILLLRELKNHGDIEAVGFVDDDPGKIGTIFSGVKVLGSGESLEKIIRDFRVDEVVISIATVSPKALTQILSKCRRISVPAKIIPSLQEIVTGRISISQVRKVRIEDLLGRGSIVVAEFGQEVREAYAGKRILVTGAGGSIGSELVRQLLLFGPSMIGLLDKDENSVYELEQELKFKDPKAQIEPHIADLRHRERLSAVFAELKPEVVFHAAAHKHVPLMEMHPCEAVLNNVCGTRNLVDASRDHDVDRFVFISTDKAVNPANIMGATKRVGELLVQACANGAPRCYASVRFGNVMGSRGSVIPLFQKQIAEGGPITVTHRDVVRFFMTIPEAVQLVLCAGTLANGGEVFVLDMGSPRNILDLAHETILLSGLQPGKDIQIAITGLRPGEKLREELIGSSENLCPTRFEKLFMILPRLFDDKAFFESTANLVKAAQQNDRNAVYEILSGMELGFCPQVKRSSG